MNKKMKNLKIKDAVWLTFFLLPILSILAFVIISMHQEFSLTSDIRSEDVTYSTSTYTLSESQDFDYAYIESISSESYTALPTVYDYYNSGYYIYKPSSWTVDSSNNTASIVYTDSNTTLVNSILWSLQPLSSGTWTLSGSVYETNVSTAQTYIRFNYVLYDSNNSPVTDSSVYPVGTYSSGLYNPNGSTGAAFVQIEVGDMSSAVSFSQAITVPSGYTAYFGVEPRKLMASYTNVTHFENMSITGEASTSPNGVTSIESYSADNVLLGSYEIPAAVQSLTNYGVTGYTLDLASLRLVNDNDSTDYTDISSYISATPYLPCEASGSIVFVRTYSSNISGSLKLVTSDYIFLGPDSSGDLFNLLSYNTQVAISNGLGKGWLDNTFIYRLFVAIVNIFGIGSNYAVTNLCLYLTYFTILCMLKLTFSILMFLPNLCQRFIESIGGDRE